MGYNGLELACWGDHFEVDKALSSDAYIKSRWDILHAHGLTCYAISNHLVGQCVCDPIDERHKSILPSRLWGTGEAEGVRQRAAQEMKDTAAAAARLGVKVVNGFTGSAVWHMLYFFPPTPMSAIEAGFRDFAARWNPIFDAFDAAGVLFGLEVHPTEIAYDIHTTRLAAGGRGQPPHVRLQLRPLAPCVAGHRPGEVHRRLRGRIYHVHIKDARRTLDGASSILASHLAFGDRAAGGTSARPGAAR